MDTETLVKRLADLFYQCHMLSKSWDNSFFWIIPYLQKMNKYKRQFSDHISYQYHTKFYVFHRPSNQLNDMLKHLSLMLDGSKKSRTQKTKIS